MIVTMNIGKWAYNEVKKRGHIEAFGDLIGITGATLYYWKNGKSIPKTYTLGLVLEGLGYKTFLNNEPFDLLNVAEELQKRFNGNMARFERNHAIKSGYLKNVIYSNNARLDYFLDTIGKFGTLEVRKVAA